MTTPGLGRLATIGRTVPSRDRITWRYQAWQVNQTQLEMNLTELLLRAAEGGAVGQQGVTERELRVVKHHFCVFLSYSLSCFSLVCLESHGASSWQI